jgi:hypothetical protein
MAGRATVAVYPALTMACEKKGRRDHPPAWRRLTARVTARAVDQQGARLVPGCSRTL